MDKNNLAVIRQSFANAAISHKTHEMAAIRKTAKARGYKIANIVLMSLVLVLLVAQTVVHGNFIFSYLGAGLSAAEIILLIIQLTFNIEPEITAHKNTALKYMAARDRYKLLLADALSSKADTSSLRGRRDGLLHEYQTISELALQTTQDDYDNAMLNLKIKEDHQNSWSDKQINSLLPKELQSNM